MQLQAFSHNDVENLKNESSEHTKIELIRKLHHNFNLNSLDTDERLIAEEILRYFAADVSVRIRQSISTKFAENINLPRDIALKLANDLEDIVALPIIENSSVLEEKDLVSIIEAGKVTRQTAVAKRANLTDNLCAHIIYRASPEVIASLINNKRSSISDNNTDILIKNNSKDPMLMRLMIQNKKIIIEQAHSLLISVSDELQKLLIVEYDIPSNVVNNLIHESKETMTLNMIASNLRSHDGTELANIIDKLHNENELSFSMLVRSLSLGNLPFFEAALAKLAVVPLENVHKLLWASGSNKGFRALYSKCELPESMADAMYELMVITREENSSQDGGSIKLLPHRVLNRLSRTSVTNKVNNLDYLVTIVAYNLKKSIAL